MFLMGTFVRRILMLKIALFLTAIFVASTAYAGKAPKKLTITIENESSFYGATDSNGKAVKCYVDSSSKRHSGKAKTKNSKTTWKSHAGIKKSKKNKFGVSSNQYSKAKQAAKLGKKACKETDPPVEDDDDDSGGGGGEDEPESGLICGNSLIETEIGEECDDGNTISGDGCSSICKNELCGDGTRQINLGEECDDGNTEDSDGCSSTCTVEGTVITPGSGFGGDTPDPDPVGNPSDAGYSADVIAHWNVAPYQTFTDQFNVGVVAFHINGINRVEFSVNGGTFTPITEAAFNPRTGTVEYWAKIRATDFSDGVIEVRAIAYPSDAGQPRLLDSLYLNTNSNQTLPTLDRYVSLGGSDTTGDGSTSAPFRTIMKAARSIQEASGTNNADGGFIYLTAGNHTLGSFNSALETTTANRWLTIRPAAGLTKDDVRINASGTEGIKTKLVRFQDLEIKTSLQTDAALEDYFWAEDSSFIGNGRTQNVDFIPSSWTRYFVTDSTISDNKNGLAGRLQRNITVSTIGAEAFSGAELVVNSSVTGIDASQTSFNPYVINFDVSGGTIENRIYYGVSAVSVDAQCIYVNGGSGNLNSIAFVNFLCDESSTEIIFSEWASVTSNHLLFWHMTSDQDFLWRISKNALSNVSWRANSVSGMSNIDDAGADVIDSQDVAHNHYVNTIMGLNITPGTDVTTGSPGYTDESAGNFQPASGSTLLNRVTSLIVPIDIEGDSRTAPGTVGAFE
ncbi:MAG: DUF4215 domain-containing protein [Deltaproteobacteria bacterium]|nr:DUF4215 domain-containing protein [Deltaproteobacteria bacterium]